MNTIKEEEIVKKLSTLFNIAALCVIKENRFKKTFTLKNVVFVRPVSMDRLPEDCVACDCCRVEFVAVLLSVKLDVIVGVVG